MITAAVDQQALAWSHELAVAAGRHLQKLDGCSVYPHYIIDDGLAYAEISEIATFDKHARHFLFPNRAPWEDTNEMIWDAITDFQHDR
jgi:hypothetical protein